MFLVCILFVFGLCTEYSIVIDAGSTSSKLKVYFWDDFKKISQVSASFEKMKALTKYLSKSVDEFTTDFKGFIDQALPFIPQNQKQISFYLGATAGLRLQLVNDSEFLIDQVRQVLPTLYDFKYEDRNIRVLSGEEEGIFGWITVQYLSGDFEMKKGTSGALDMGGASTQISFIPQKQQILAEKKTIKVFGNIVDVYSHSFLTYGMNEAFDQVNQNIVYENPSAESFTHPCLFKDFNDTIDGHLFYGSSDPYSCHQEIRKILRMGSFCQYPKETCSVCSEYVPILPKLSEMKFYAFSGFEYMPSGLKLNPEGLKLSFLNSTGWEFCSKNFSYAEHHSGMEEGYVWNQCFNLIYGLDLLLDGYKFDPDAEGQVKFDGKVGGIDVGWALGSLIYEKMLEDENNGGGGGTEKVKETKKDYIVAPMIVGYVLFVVALLVIFVLLCCVIGLCLVLGLTWSGVLAKKTRLPKKQYEIVSQDDMDYSKMK